jgi:hypothetical protein
MGYNGFVTNTGHIMETNDDMKKFLRGMGPKPESSYEKAMRSAAEFRQRCERIKKQCQEEIVIEEQNGIL